MRELQPANEYADRAVRICDLLPDGRAWEPQPDRKRQPGGNDDDVRSHRCSSTDG